MKTALYSQKRLYSAVFYAFKMLRQRNENIFYALFVSVPAKQTRMAGRKGMLLFFTSIIFRLDFGIALGMPAYRANFRRACGIRYVSAYHAHPHGGAPLTKNLAVLNVGSQLVVTLFMRFFNVPHAGEQFRQLLKAFTAGGCLSGKSLNNLFLFHICLSSALPAFYFLIIDFPVTGYG